MAGGKSAKGARLGRGLSALIGEAEADNAELRAEAGSDSAGGSGPKALPIEQIKRNPDQPRRRFTDLELDELAQSIQENGVLQPILVRPVGEGAYQIVAGERRWRAAQRAGLHAIPALVRTLTDREVLEVAIVENVQRADLNPREEAQAYRALMDQFGHTQDAVAQVVGKSRSHVANSLRLLSLPDDVLRLLDEGALSAGHARAILTAERPESLAREIVDKGLNVRQAEALARAAHTEPGAPSPSRGSAGSRGEKDPDTRALELDLIDRLGLEVDLRPAGAEAGEVRIRYQTLEQLDDLCRRLSQRI
ncbi:MAG: ParB/RepB/Spo0J family partition protein [Maricaulaceae bacterium]